MPNDKKNPGEEEGRSGDTTRAPLPSTGEGADSALEILKKKRKEVPPADPSLPLKPPAKP